VLDDLRIEFDSEPSSHAAIGTIARLSGAGLARHPAQLFELERGSPACSPTTGNSPAATLLARRLYPAIAVPFAVSGQRWEQPMSQHSPSHDVIVQIKVKLLGVAKPPVWRRLQVPAATRLDQLHEIIQAALGWENYHMHVFSFGDEEFGIPDSEIGFSDERQVTLGELIAGVDDRFRYTYDFGDEWEHEILIEELLETDPNIRYPILVAAKGACPPEDCGGPWGYASLRAILADPHHDEHQEMLEWLGLNAASEFDPAAVSTEDISYELAFSGAGR
jgi:Plasmid pRiA4b ORF-3-like protein